jgi:hypothetical protein
VLLVLIPANFGGRGHSRNHSVNVIPIDKLSKVGVIIIITLVLTFANQLKISVVKAVEYDKSEIYTDTGVEGCSSPSTAVQKVCLLISIRAI